MVLLNGCLPGDPFGVRTSGVRGESDGVLGDGVFEPLAIILFRRVMIRELSLFLF